MASALFDFVPFGRRVTRDPYAIYERMRETGDVLKTSYGAYIVHRYGDIRQVHGDHAGFSMGAAGAGAGASWAPSTGTVTAATTAEAKAAVMR